MCRLEAEVEEAGPQHGWSSKVALALETMRRVQVQDRRFKHNNTGARKVVLP